MKTWKRGHAGLANLNIDVGAAAGERTALCARGPAAAVWTTIDESLSPIAPVSTETQVPNSEKESDNAN